MTVLSCCSASVMQRQEKKKIARTECSVVTVKGVSEDLGQEHVASSRKKKKKVWRSWKRVGEAEGLLTSFF